MSSQLPIDLKQFRSAQKACKAIALEFVTKILEKGPPEGWTDVWSTEERKLRTVYKVTFVAEWPRAKATRVFDMVEGILFSSGFWTHGKITFRSGKRNQNTITYDWEHMDRMTREEFQKVIEEQDEDEEDIKDRMLEEAEKKLKELKKQLTNMRAALNEAHVKNLAYGRSE